MQAHTADPDRLVDFQCPICGSLGFETLGVRWHSGVGSDKELGHLEIRCLRCLYVCEHPLHTATSDLLVAQAS